MAAEFWMLDYLPDGSCAFQQGIHFSRTVIHFSPPQLALPSLHSRLEFYLFFALAPIRVPEIATTPAQSYAATHIPPHTHTPRVFCARLLCRLAGRWGELIECSEGCDEGGEACGREREICDGGEVIERGGSSRRVTRAVARGFVK